MRTLRWPSRRSAWSSNQKAEAQHTFVLTPNVRASHLSRACLYDGFSTVLLRFFASFRPQPREEAAFPVSTPILRPMSGRTGQRPIMPRPSFPPTPAPSTDITGKSNANAAQFDSNFVLPPAAIASGRGSTSSSATSNASDSSYRPLSPSSPSATTKAPPSSRKRSSTTQSIITKNDYSLPPPPTRSRKIIQMDPKKSQELAKPQPQPSPNSKTAPAGAAKKKGGATTAQGRKIARKTAHSLIERRRRSKMNEEFGVLKDMIPACNGQEMHKLAILQVNIMNNSECYVANSEKASIEYMRYLQDVRLLVFSLNNVPSNIEQCVTELKASHRSRRDSPTPTSPRQARPPPILRQEETEEDDEEEDEDEDMEDAVSPTHVANVEPKSSHSFTNVSPAIYPSDRSVHSTTTSPNIYPSDRRHYSTMASPAIHPSDPQHYSLASSVRSAVTSPSIQASPVFSAQTPSQSQFQNPFHGAPSSRGSTSLTGAASFALTSPALGPQADREDHEVSATEALLMLNTDRRSWSEATKRGMSVKDLLSG